MPRNRGTAKAMAQKIRTLLKRIALTSLLLLGIYLIWCTIIWNRQPTIAVDYLAITNSKALSVSEEDAAYPLYLDAAIARKGNEEPGFYDEYEDPIRPHWPHQGGWEEFAKWLHQNSEIVELIREAGRKPDSGYVFGRTIEKETLLWGEEWSSQWDQNENLTIMDGSLINVTLPALGMFKRLGFILQYDARQAAFEGDQSRFISDVQAMLNIARHIKEPPTIIGDLVSLSILAMANDVAGETLALSPEIFDTEHLMLLSELLLGSDELYEVRPESERLVMLDTMQRLYTDDGNGDGSFIVQSLPILEFVTTFSDDSISTLHQVVAFLSGPIVSWRVASRQETLAEFNRLFDSQIEHGNLPLYLRESKMQYPREVKDDWARSKFIIVDVMISPMDRVLDNEFYRRAIRDAVVAAIAMELYRRAEGKWPTQLNQAMEEPSIDPWTGEPMQIAFDDGRPLIYSFGVDRNDDAGALWKKEGITLRSPWAPYLEPEIMFDFDFEEDEANLLARTWEPADSADLPDGDWILWPPFVD